MLQHTLIRRFGAVACAGALAVAGLTTPTVALSEETPPSTNVEELRTDVNELVSKVEATTTVYKEAEQTIKDLEAQIAENEAKTAELEKEIPEQRKRTAASVKDMYILQQTSDSLLSLILSAESFDEFISAMRYTDAIHAHNVEEITKLSNMIDELAQTNADLQLKRSEAQSKQDEAKAALEEARGAREELQTRAVAVALSEQDDREEAIKVAQAAIAASNSAAASAEDPSAEPVAATFTTSSGNEATISVPDSANVSTEPIVENVTSEEKEDWASRINAYLEGSPLEGYGQTFADAAAQYGVDPRLSPAISTIESGKGSVCFQDHNAWGWGNYSYDDWESAIYSQVEGLATGYDGTLTLEGAKRYCSDSYQEWYSSVASEMDGI